MSYKLRAKGVIHPNGFSIPEDPKNRHWQEYQDWLDAGNTPQPADDPPPVPSDRIAKNDALVWLQNNPQAKQIFELSIPEIETQVTDLITALFPSSSTPNKNKKRLLLMTLIISVRVFAKRFSLID